MRSYRSVSVCLVLLCVLLLTAVIVLCVLINTNNQQFNIKTKNITEERDQLLTKYTNITEERDKVLTKYTNITEERDQLLTKYNDITEERDQLLTKYTNITKERDQLLTKYTNITEERDQLLTKYTNITEERDQLLTKYTNITEERDQLLTKYTNITEERDQLLTKYTNITEKKDELIVHCGQKKDLAFKGVVLTDGWIYYQSSLYFISSEKKSWNESRRYCRERGADLIIINNKEEQDFIMKFGKIKVWIGLTDIDEEGRWKWVDNSTLSYRFWVSGEPSGGTKENCVESYSLGWNDNSCNRAQKWICEKKT
nr:CD209 antigen-like protein B [Misgurnus anguillicaudatus]